MNRLEKKCIIASVTLHALLVLTVILGSALMPEAKNTNPPILTMVDLSKITDNPTSGGTPTPNPLPPPPTAKPPEPEAPPIPNPPQQRPEQRPAQPVRNDPPPTRTPNPNLQLAQRTPPRPTGRNNQPNTQQTDDQARQDAIRRQKQIQKQISGALQSINDKFSPATTVTSPPGPGGDTALMTNYNDLVGNRYREAWNPPASLDDATATVTVTVVIYRDGRVKSHEILQRSGNAAMDKSIEATLQNVTYVAQFPSESKDLERKFTIKFNLAAKRALG